ncbi:unnamed protein product [Schistocephalus solidus]|uniref:Ectonucleoside triphosphate diphosphohydrolase 5 n=1 Tax=Schistocephalus solidus TaxID=70667 RepID=A0A183T0T9_SCHSO|nr:unnamed protein product [Schistocephalus solidus]
MLDRACPFHLISEHLFSVEPGLSTFAKFPSEAIDNLRPLVEYSRKYVPEEWRSSTPIILRATAGLRLLPEQSANDLLASVCCLASLYDLMEICVGCQFNALPVYIDQFFKINAKTMTTRFTAYFAPTERTLCDYSEPVFAHSEPLFVLFLFIYPFSSCQTHTQVSSLIKESGFWLPSEGAVGIMEGADEGIFAWITLNFLRGSLFTAFSQGPPNKSGALSGLLDFGGGSTQLTFLPLERAMEASTPRHFLHTMPDCYVEHLRFPSKLYAHSYLGLGLMSARRSMLLTYTRKFKQANSTASVLQSPCLPAGLLSEWSHSGQSLTVASSRQQPFNDSEEAFEHCYESATSILRSSSSDNLVHQPSELNSHDIFVLSFVYTRAVEAGLVNATVGGLITIRKLLETAKFHCTHPQTQHPFMCMDLTYISALLHEGFGISLDKELHVRRSISLQLFMMSN